MAYLMSDVAAGSNAAQTLMQNMGAAPLDAQVGQAKAEQAIAEGQKAKLSALIAETNFKSSEDSKAKLQALQQTTDFKEAVAAGDFGKVLQMTGATQIAANDVENGAKTLASAETYDAKKLANEQKQLDQKAQQIGNAYGVISAVPDDKVEEYAKRLPAPVLKTLVDSVGAESWNKMSGTEKKEAAKNLMLNAKGQLATHLKELDAERQQQRLASNERIAMMRINAAMERKLAGGDARDMRDWNLYVKAQDSIERSGKKTLEALDAKVEKAQANLDKTIFFDRDETVAYEKAVAERNAFLRSQTQKELDLAASAPDFPGKKGIIENLKTQLEMYPEADKPKAQPKQEAKPVPSNKLTPEQTATVEKANAAIKAGADPEKVKQRLKQAGVPGY
jgi:hypothetical protein